MKVFLKVLKAIVDVIMTTIIVVGIVFIVAYFFGIEPYVVESGSMEPTIQTGSICFVNTKTKYDSIKENDIIAFRMGSDSRATHRAISVTSGGIATKGDNNELKDEGLVTQDRYVGKTLFSIPKVGFIVKIIQTTKGKIIFATFIIVLFLAGLLLGDSSKKKAKLKEIEASKKEAPEESNKDDDKTKINEENSEYKADNKE